MKLAKYFAALILISISLMVGACDSKKKNPPVKFNKTKQVKVMTDVEIPYQELGGVKTIPVKLNGVSMDMIFDTGCSGISISLNELLMMQKNGKFSQSDIVGVSEATIADGSVVETGVINLTEVEIGEHDGIKLHNIQASVSLNQTAPILLGNGVLDEVASVEVDNVNKVIKFKRH